MGTIGKKGEGPHEYTEIHDFDADRDHVYVLNEKRLLSYLPDGTFVKETPLSILAYSLKVMEDASLLLYTSREDSLIYQLNATGRIEQALVSKSPAGELSRSIAFKRYQNGYLCPIGNSNEAISYAPEAQEFKKLTLTDLREALTLEKENKIRSDARRLHRQPEYTGVQFDGLICSETQLLLGSIKDKEVTLWTQTGQGTKAYSASSIENDLTYMPFLRLLMDNTSCSECFLSYCQPYRIAEGLKENKAAANEKNYQKLQTLLSSIKNLEEANPVIIEYTLKQ